MVRVRWCVCVCGGACAYVDGVKVEVAAIARGEGGVALLLVADAVEVLVGRCANEPRDLGQRAGGVRVSRQAQVVGPLARLLELALQQEVRVDQHQVLSDRHIKES